MSFSTIGRRSFAFGSVVMICSCLISAEARCWNNAVRWLERRLNLRWAIPCGIASFLLYPVYGSGRRLRPGSVSIMVFEALGELFDILRRPARHFHAEMQAHLRQHFLDLVQRLAAEVRGAEHLGFGLLHQIADVDDVVVLQTVRRTH